MIRPSLALATVVVALLTARPASADVIVESTAADFVHGTTFPGQFFTTPSGGPWNNITFNFFSSTSAPTAAGNLYLFTADPITGDAYTGTPADLAATAASYPGYIATSTGISGGAYQFAPGITLLPDTEYFVYSDAAQTLAGASAGGSYFADNATDPFQGTEGSFTYRVTGTVVAQTEPVPEPATLAVFAAVVGAGAFVRRRKLART